MRFFLTCLLTLLLSSTGFAQEKKVEKVENKNDQGVVIESYTLVDSKMEGAYRRWYGSGKIHIEGSHTEGKRDGNWRWYNESGSKANDWNYQDGELSGTCTNYYSNGQKSCESTFEKGQAKGTWTEWHQDGQVSKKGQAYGNSYEIAAPLKTGAWVWYHANGKVSHEFSYVEDKENGECTEYYDNGKKWVVSHFELGVMKGKWTAWYSDGQLHSTGETYGHLHNDHKNPLKTGPWLWYHANGNRYYEATYIEDKADGPVVEYYAAGPKWVESNFVTSVVKGKWTSYHVNGQIAATGEAYGHQHNDHKSPLRTGPWVWYHDNGNKYFECSYIENLPDGPATEYYMSGPKSLTCEFDNGATVGTWTKFFENGQVNVLGEAMGQSYNSYHSPIRTGIWVQYYEGGVRSFEGNYVNGVLDGAASWYHANGQKKLMAEYVEGSPAGTWTQWFDNGKTECHGHCRGMAYNDVTYGIKQGPWVHYHNNGNKESEGRYADNVKVGAWVYYDADGKLKTVHNYINGESSALSDAELPDGSHVYRASNPDGSSDTLTFDKDGNLVSNKHELPLDKQKPYVQYTDPDTGETVTITHDSDGHPTRTRGHTTKDDKGNRHTVETDDDGKSRVIDENADGSKSITETWPDGTLRETKRDKAGNVTRTRTNPDGSVTQYENHPDGSRSRKRTDADGNLLDETFRDPAGVETTNLADGTSTRRHKDENGNTVETTTRPNGGKSRVVRDKDGNIISRDDNWGEREPGQTLYEDQENGHDWNKLTEEEKKKLAEKEAALKESGGLDEARLRADEAAMRERDEARAESDAAAAEAEKDLERKPASEGAEKEKKEVNWDELSLAVKAVELALTMPDVLIEHIKSELTKDMSDEEAEEAKVADMLKQDARGLPGWLARNPKVLKNWEERIKPTLKSGASAIAAAMSVLKGIQYAEKGEYFNALECFADASVSVFGVLSPSHTAKLEKELGRNPTKYASAVKNVITFAKELGRPLKAGDSRNYGILVREAINFLVNIYQAVPVAERQAFMQRYMPTFRKWFNAASSKVGGTQVRWAQILLGVVDCAEEIYKLISEWGGENDAANITSLAKKVGPKAIGMLVMAATGSETAGSVAEYIAQMGADYMARLGDEAREAAKAALKSAMDNANAYAEMRKTMNELALAAGMSPEDSNSYTYLSTIVSGHSSRMVLSDMRQKKDAAGVREAMQAWRRVNADMGSRCGAVQYFYDLLVPENERDPDNEATYQTWFATWVDNARRTAAHIGTMLTDYAQGSAARRFLAAWKDDLDGLVKTYG